MHRLAYTLVFLLVSLPAAAFAITCANEITPIKGESRVGETTCSRCSSITDFARIGAAVLLDNHLAASNNIHYPRYNRVSVKNGQHAATVTINNVTTDTPVSVGEWGISYGIRQQHRGVVAVNATPYRGNIIGSPWTGALVQRSELAKVCKAIKLEKEAKEKAQKERQRAIISEGIYDTSSYWQNGNPHFLFKPPKRKVWVPVTGDESCGTEPCPWWDDEEYSDAYTRIDTIPYWYRELLERRNEQLEPRITTEEIRSSGGGRGGFGFGGFAVAPGGVAESQHGTEKVK